MRLRSWRSKGPYVCNCLLFPFCFQQHYAIDLPLLGGILVLSTSAFIHIDTLGRVFTIPVNSNFSTISGLSPSSRFTSLISDSKYAHLGLDLTKCTINHLGNGSDDGPSNFIFSLLNGSIYILSLFLNPGYSGVFRAEISVIATTLPSYVVSSISTRSLSISAQNMNLGFFGTSEGPQNLFFEIWQNGSAEDAASSHPSFAELDDDVRLHPFMSIEHHCRRQE